MFGNGRLKLPMLNEVSAWKKWSRPGLGHIDPRDGAASCRPGVAESAANASGFMRLNADARLDERPVCAGSSLERRETSGLGRLDDQFRESTQDSARVSRRPELESRLASTR